jgi:hypothetical protein
MLLPALLEVNGHNRASAGGWCWLVYNAVLPPCRCCCLLVCRSMPRTLADAARFLVGFVLTSYQCATSTSNKQQATSARMTCLLLGLQEHAAHVGRRCTVSCGVCADWLSVLNKRSDDLSAAWFAGACRARWQMLQRRAGLWWALLLSQALVL